MYPVSLKLNIILLILFHLSPILHILHLILLEYLKENTRSFPGSPVVEALPSNAGGTCLIPGQGAGIPHASWLINQNIKQKQCCKNVKKKKDFKNGPNKKKILKKKYSNHARGWSQPTEFCFFCRKTNTGNSQLLNWLSIHISLHHPLHARCIFDASVDDKHFKVSHDHSLPVKFFISAAFLFVTLFVQLFAFFFGIFF